MIGKIHLNDGGKYVYVILTTDCGNKIDYYAKANDRKVQTPGARRFSPLVQRLLFTHGPKGTSHQVQFLFPPHSNPNRIAVTFRGEKRLSQKNGKVSHANQKWP